MVLWWLAGCSLGVTQWEPCTSSVACRQAFGLGSVCGEGGYCETAEVQPRCDTTWPADLLDRPEDYPGIRVIGSLFDHSTDVPEKQSARLAVKQADESEGIGGAPLGLVQCSYAEDSTIDGLDAEAAAIAMASYLVADLGAYAIVGPATSGVTEAVYQGVDGPLIVSPSATSPALTYLDAADHDPGEAGRLWRTAPPDSLQGEVLAGLVQDAVFTRVQHVALIYQVGPYGEGLAQVFADHYGNADRTFDRYPFENDTQRDSAMSSAAVPATDAIVFISSDVPDVSAFLLALSVDADAPAMPIFLADAAHDAELLAATEGTDAEDLWPNIVGTSPAVPSGDRYDAFAAAYAGAYDGQSAGDSSYSAYAYDAAWLTIYGATWALAEEGGLTGQHAANGLTHLSAKGGEEIATGPVSWLQLQAEFAKGTDVNVVGASGELDYDPDTEETTGPIEVWGIDRVGGEPGFVVLDTVAP